LCCVYVLFTNISAYSVSRINVLWCVSCLFDDSPSFAEDLTIASESEKTDDGQNGALQEDDLVEREVEAINQATSSKVSTGCGPSPPPDLPNQKDEEDNAKRMVSTSIGTSPPPQNISTQVRVS